MQLSKDGSSSFQPVTRRGLMAAGAAEYAGWMAQECRDDSAAIWWTDRAVHLAAAGADTELATYAQVRRSLISLYRGDVFDAVQLAVRAVESDAPPRVRGLAAQHLAQGRAVELLTRDSTDPAQPVLGASNLLISGRTRGPAELRRG